MRIHHGVTSAIAGLLLGALAAAPAPAEVYRWVDENGELHFTGDLNQVPPRYRNRATAPLTDEKSTLNVTPQEAAPDPGSPREERLRALRRLNAQGAAAPSKAQPRRIPGDPAPKPEKAQPTPRKYERDCDNRNASGRCHSKLNPEWVQWNSERKANTASEE
jgi:hypothetical protein